MYFVLWVASMRQVTAPTVRDSFSCLSADATSAIPDKRDTWYHIKNGVVSAEPSHLPPRRT